LFTGKAYEIAMNRTTKLEVQPMSFTQLPTETLRTICEHTAVLGVGHLASLPSSSNNLDLPTGSQINTFNAERNDPWSHSDSAHLPLPPMDLHLLEAPLYRLSNLSITCKRLRAIATPLLFGRVCMRRPEWIDIYMDSEVFRFAR